MKLRWNSFLRNSAVLDFQQAVVSSMESVRLDQMKHLTIRVLKGSAGEKALEKHLTIRVPKGSAGEKALKDIEELAIIGFGEDQRASIHVHALFLLGY